MEAVGCCFHPASLYLLKNTLGLESVMLRELEWAGMGKGVRGKPEFRKGVRGGQSAPYLPALKIELTLSPPRHHQRPPASEVTRLSPRLEARGGLRLRTGCLGTGWGSPLLLNRIASLWAGPWPQALPPPSAPIPPSVDTIGAVCCPKEIFIPGPREAGWG